MLSVFGESLGYNSAGQTITITVNPLPILLLIQKPAVMVFDRWGEKVFSGNVPGAFWDGTYRGQPCKEDVYVWKLEATSSNHESKKLNGFVTLYR